MTAKVLVEELINSLLPVAHQMLAEHREFYPYGGYMDRDGRITHVGVTEPETEYPKSADMIDALETTFRDLARRKVQGDCHSMRRSREASGQQLEERCDPGRVGTRG